jgi:predicted amidophosphoribosyltransferase
MDTGNLVRDAFEVLILIAVGGMLWNVLRRWRAGQLPLHRCPECGGPASRAYPRCRHCGAELPEER